MSFTYHVTDHDRGFHAMNLAELQTAVAELADWENVTPMAGIEVEQISGDTGARTLVHIELRGRNHHGARYWSFRANDESEAFAFLNEQDARPALHPRPGPTP